MSQMCRQPVFFLRPRLRKVRTLSLSVPELLVLLLLTLLASVKLEQGTVTTLLEEKSTIKGVMYKNKTGEEMRTYAPLTIIENLSCFVSLILENCELPHANHGHVILGDPSPILFYPIGSTEVRCLVDVPGTKVPSVTNGEMAQYLKTIVAPQVPRQLLKAFLATVDKGIIRTMQNKSMLAAPRPTPGAILLGDAFNLRHPLTGGGMTVALSDIVLLMDLLRPLTDFNDAPLFVIYHKHLSWCPLQGVLASPDLARQEMREACFDYLSLGGVCSNGPISLLSGLNPRPIMPCIRNQIPNY
ncbi:unnamed protein product [Malus baccata var. baccata]